MPRNQEPPLRILLVEDETNDELLLRETLNASEGLNCTLVVATRLGEACAELAAKEFDIILSDLSLPDGRGLDTVKALRAAAPASPIVVLTGVQDEALAIAAIQAGAQDYLVKDKTGVEILVRTLRYALERARIQESLRIALAEKEILLKEIHHRVKNNMQVICSLLSLQALQADDPKVQAMFEESQGRISAMGLVYQRLHHSGDLARIDLPGYLKTLVAMVLRSHSAGARIAAKIDVDNLLLGLDTAIPLGLITNELLTHSLKHAFAGRASGVVQVVLHAATAGQCELMVANDGAEDLPANTKPAVMGLKLVEMLARQIKGTLAIEFTRGMRYTIRFPATGAA
ncbi:MAG TPA: histidine kinase dimerization/phosphoacceptor domain -containing protein [Opitutaceae bacterium]|jgi:two-component sensor histidine kinase|nr:histidine kinase dimerization/phosphoacceptor domain -containing protein [Opitutaceae bacterium]